MSDKVFAEGIWFNMPRDGAPDFVKGKIAVDREKFSHWMSQQEVDKNGKIYMNVKESRGGKIYIELDTWKPTPRNDEPVPSAKPSAEEASDIPF